MKILALLVAGLLAACASTPAADIAALEASLAAADTAALAYINLPACGAPSATAVCSAAPVVANIGLAAQTAYTAVKAAETAKDQSSIAAARTAVVALQSVVAAVATPP